MKHNLLTYFVKTTIVLVLSCPFGASGQLTTNSSLSPQQLVENFLIGKGVQVSNVTLGAQTSISQLGTFSNSNSNLGLSNGILLSTGWAQDVSISGQNFNNGFTSTGINCPGGIAGLCLAGDADLDAIVGTTTKDAAVLEFDFVPLSDTIRFRYVFASEEYNEYTCSQFNDVFAFLLNGPGFSNTNIAKIPNTNTPVAINTVNNGFVGVNGAVANCTGGNGSLSYSNFFIDNWGGSFIQFDGMTTIFEAFAVVQPCQTYHIKLAIADAVDGAFDSAVFLEGNSFSSDVVEVAVNTPNSDSIIVENCNTGSVTLSFENKVNAAQNISYTVLGTATNGVDYQFLSGVATIPSGQKTTSINIIPIIDSQIEGTETIILEIQKALCITDTVVIFLRDEVLLDMPIVSCDTANAVSITYGWQAVANATSYRVSSDNGTIWDTLPASSLLYTVYGLNPNNTVILLVQPLGGYSVCTPHPIGSDTCSTISCTLSGQLVNTTGTSCFGGSDGTATVSANGGNSPLKYVLDNQLSQSSPTFQNVTGGNHIISIIDADSCQFDISFTINQPPPIQISVDTIIHPSCQNSNDGAIYAAASNGVGSYTFVINADTNTTGDFNGLSAGIYTLVVIDDNDCSNSMIFSITNPAPIILSPISSSLQCVGESNGTATVIASGGTISQQYQFLWDDNQTDSIATNLAFGNHFVTVTDDNGCTATANVLVAQPDTIRFLNAISTPTTCFGDSDGSAQVAVTGGVGNFTYLWNTTDNTPSLNNIMAGNYTLTVTDGNGCQDSITVTVQQPDQLIISSFDIQNVRCHGEANGGASLTMNQSGTFTYAWLPTFQTTSTAQNLDSGWHYAVVTNQDGCMAIDSFIIEQPAPLISITQELQGASCFGTNDGKAMVMVSGGDPFFDGHYNYSWNSVPPQSGQIAINLAGGQTYQVAITDSLGCQLSDNVTISQPDSIRIDLNIQPINCYNGTDGAATATASGGTPNYMYQWSNNNSTPTISNLSAGIYFLTVTDVNNCTNVFDVNITEPTQLKLLMIGEDVLCKGEKTGIVSAYTTGGTPNYSFIWNNNQNASTIENLSAGQYFVTVTDDNSCQISDSIFISEPSSQVEATFLTENVTCFGGRDGRIFVQPQGGIVPYQYSVDGANFTNAATIVGLAADEYPLVVRDDNGCIFDTMTTIVEPKELTVFAGEDMLLVWGEQVNLQAIVENGIAPFRYQWSPSDGLSCNDCPNPIAQPEQEMFYNLLVEDSRGCRAKDVVAIRLIKEHNIYVATAFTPNNDGVNDFLFVQSDENKVKTILKFEVFSRWGSKVFEAQNFEPNIPALGWDGRFQGELMSSAVFGWILEVEFLDGDIEVYKGNSTLLRN